MGKENSTASLILANLSPSTITFALASNNLLQRFNSFSGVATARLIVLKAVCVREEVTVEDNTKSSSQRTISKFRGKGEGNIYM